MHSQQETRYIAVGRNQSGRAMFVAFAIKQAQGGLHRIRPKAHALCMKRKYNGMKKIPTLKTDQQAEAFLDQDLSDLDFSQFKTMRLEFAPKSAALHLRLPEALLEGLKVRAKAQGVPYTRYVRMLLENDLAKGHS